MGIKELNEIVCQNPECEYYLREEGKKIIKRGKYKNGNQRYYCKHCGVFFAETKGTVFYRKHLTENEIKLIFRLFHEKNRIRSIERITGHHRDTVSGLLKDALRNRRKANEFLLKNVEFTPEECSRFWSLLDKKNTSSTFSPDEIKHRTAALYVSTSEDDKHEYLRFQKEKLEKHCEKKKYKIYKRYIDRSISEKSATRPAFKQLMLDAENGKFDTVIVTKLVQFGDTITDCLLKITKLESYNVSFAAIDQGINTSTSKKKLIIRIIDACSEFEDR